ncbi:MAG: hypothetical protein AAB584_01145 [Patescibacteria group bacterium]
MPVTLEEAQIYDPYEAYVNQIIDDGFKYDQLHKKLASLPENLLDFIFSPELAEFIKDKIVAPFNLNKQQTKETAKVVLELILTDIYLGNIVSEVQGRLAIDDQKAKTIAGLIVAELFAPILEDLKKMHIEKFAKNIPLQSQQQGDDRTVDLRNNL